MVNFFSKYVNKSMNERNQYLPHTSTCISRSTPLILTKSRNSDRYSHARGPGHVHYFTTSCLYTLLLNLSFYAVYHNTSSVVVIWTIWCWQMIVHVNSYPNHLSSSKTDDWFKTFPAVLNIAQNRPKSTKMEVSPPYFQPNIHIVRRNSRTNGPFAIN